MIDNRGSHFYLALYWAQALAAQSEDQGLQHCFMPVAEALAKNEEAIVAELLAVQGQKVNLNGYYRPDPVLAEKAMRPSALLNSIIDGIQCQ